MIESDKQNMTTDMKLKNKGQTESKMKINAKEKAFKCDCCDQRFSKRSNLNQHLKIHTGEKPFQCDFCEKKFTHKTQFD